MRVPTFRAVAKPETLLGLPPFFFYTSAMAGMAATATTGGEVFLGIVTALSVAVILYVISRKSPFIVHNIYCRAKYKKPRTAAPHKVSRFIPVTLLVLLFAEDAYSSAITPQAPALMDYLQTTGVVVALFGLAGLIGVSCTPYLKRLLRLPPVDSMRVRVPFDKIEQDTGVIHLSNGSTCLVIAVPGVSDSLQGLEKTKELFRHRQRCILSLAGKPVIARFATLRHRQDVHTPCLHTNPILRDMHLVWETAFAGNVFRNDHFILLSTRTNKRSERRALVEASSTICDYLEAYSAKVLRPDGSNHDPLLSFLFQYMNCYLRSVPTPPNTDGMIPDITGTADCPGLLTSATVDFDQGSTLATVYDGSFKAYQSILSWHGLADDISSDAIRAILRLPHELMLVHTARPQNTETLPAFLSRRRNQAAGFRLNPSIDQDFSDVLDLIQSDKDSLFTTQSVVIVQSETAEELQEAVTDLKRAGIRHHSTLVTEPYPLSQELWFDRFPGNDEFRRPWNLTASYNAILASFEDEPTGLHKTAWSDHPVRMFPTVDGTLYSFNFQDSAADQALGHFCVIAPSESGKTTFINFLLAGAVNIPDVAAFVFDSQEGARHALTLFGGVFSDVTVRTEVELNPLHVSDTPENRDQLARFFTQLTDATDTVSQTAIIRAVSAVFDIRDYKRRTLNALMEDAIDIDTAFYDGMKKWTTGGRFAGWFNAEKDSLDFSASQLFGFEMAQALKDPEAAAALIEYITFRIREFSAKSGLKHIIFCDEAARLFQDPNFARNAKAWFRESRKTDGVIGVAFQEPNALADLGIQETIWDNCATFILFPNRQARRADYDAFQLTEAQWEYVSGNNEIINQKNLKHSCMLIRPTRRESVILDIDLSRLGPLVRCFRSGTEANAAIRHFRSQMEGIGTWQEEYLQVA